MHSKRSAQETQLLMILSPIHGVTSEAAGICHWPSALTTSWTEGRDNSYQQRTPAQLPAWQNVEVNYSILT